MIIDQNAMGPLTFAVAIAAYVAAVSLVIQQGVGELKRMLLMTQPDTDVTTDEVHADIARKKIQIVLLSLGEIPLVASGGYLTFCTLVSSTNWTRLYRPEQLVRWAIHSMFYTS